MKSRIMLRLVQLLFIGIVISCSRETLRVPWDHAAPSEVGISGDELRSLRDSLVARNTRSFLIVKDGKVAFEWSASGSVERYGTASTVKGLAGALTLMLLVDEGRIKLDDLAAYWVPEWGEGGRGEPQVTLRHLATHSSGIPHQANTFGQPGWVDRFWERDKRVIEAVLQNPNLTFPPGTRYEYSGPGYAVLSYIATIEVNDLGYSNIQEFLQERIMRFLEVPSAAWSLSYGMTFPTEGRAVQGFWGGGSFTPRAAARIGQLLLQRGHWKGVQLIDSSTVAAFVRSTGSLFATEPEVRPAPAIGWWDRLSRVAPSLPEDAFAAIGAGHRVVLVVPSCRLVAVRFGGALAGPNWGSDKFWTTLGDHFLNPLAAAIDSDGASNGAQICENAIGGPAAGVPVEIPPAMSPRILASLDLSN